VFSIAGDIDRRDLGPARKLPGTGAAPDRAMGEQLVDVAVGVRLKGRREEQEVLAPRKMLARKGRAQENALKVIRVKVSFTPGSVWIWLVTKWPMSVFASR